MTRRMKHLAPLALVACLAAALVGCAGSAREQRDVRSDSVTDSITSGLRVLAPAGKGPWPVLVALHGFGGTGQDMVELGTRLARQGVLVFVPTYRTDVSTAEGFATAVDDIVCGYLTARRVAARYGGDLTRPVTVVGWSMGADFAVLGGLGPDGDRSTSRCPGPVQRPDVVVGLAGCYYAFDGKPVTWFRDLTGWTNKRSAVRLVDGGRDVTCPAPQSERLAAALRAAGYDVTLTSVTSADHPALVFQQYRDGKLAVRKHDAAGENWRPWRSYATHLLWSALH